MIKVCPKCRSFFEDQSLRFCRNDGLLLIEIKENSKLWEEGQKFLLESKKVQRWKNIISTIWKVLKYSAILTLLCAAGFVTFTNTSSVFIPDEKCKKKCDMQIEKLQIQNSNANLWLEDINKKQLELAKREFGDEQAIKEIYWDKKYKVDFLPESDCCTVRVNVAYVLLYQSNAKVQKDSMLNKYSCVKNEMWKCQKID